MNNQEEELDYMSDAFIQSVSVPTSGLVTVRSVARKRAGEQLHNTGELSKVERERKMRDEGLQKQVDEDNKGFSLLMKMGYKPGQGLGKNAKGRLEPVPIELPEGRSGLGLISSNKEKLQASEERWRLIREAEHERFRVAIAERYRLGRLRNQLSAARSLCYQLDTEKSITVPLCSSFWPDFEDSVDVSSSDLSKSCTAESDDCNVHRFNHPETTVETDDGDECVVSRSNIEEEEKPVDVLDKLVRYLRRKHSFCFWCSVQYESQGELLDKCPGSTEADHE